MIVYALRSGGRMDEAIVCWDARSSRAPLATYSRPGLTNQRISFDIDPTGR
jgi:telomerase Cajal body protein 1